MRNIISVSIAAVCTLIAGCSTQGSRINPLGTPKFVPQSDPGAYIETGIGENPSPALGIFLQWYVTAGAAGYNVYRSDTTDNSGNPLNFRLVTSVPLGDTTAIDVYQLTTGVKYFYALRAYASDQSLSDWSDTADISLLQRPTQISPVNGNSVDSDNVTLEWTDPTLGGWTVVRVADITASQTVWVYAFSNYYSNGSIPYNKDGNARQSLTSGHEYQWRVDRFDLGTDHQSKSAWSTFTVN